MCFWFMNFKDKDDEGIGDQCLIHWANGATKDRMKLSLERLERDRVVVHKPIYSLMVGLI